MNLDDSECSSRIMSQSLYDKQWRQQITLIYM